MRKLKTRGYNRSIVYRHAPDAECCETQGRAVTTEHYAHCVHVSFMRNADFKLLLCEYNK